MKILKNWSEFKEWVENRKPNLFAVVWVFAWRWLIIQLLVALALTFIIWFLGLFAQ